MSLANRLKKSFKHKSKWAKREDIHAWRLYDRDIPEYPFIIDLYYFTESRPFAFVWKRFQKIDIEKDQESNLIAIKETLLELGIDSQNIIIKERTPQGNQTANTKYQKLDHKGEKLKIAEKELTFLINPYDYLDTGLFLDHRPLRQHLRKKDLRGLKALNLFCYTGSLSIALARAGAEVTSVDLNPNYLDWTKENFKANDIDQKKHQFIEADCLSYLQEAEPYQFDIIIIDPPSFSVSKKFHGNLDIDRDHPFLLKAVHSLLVNGGEAYFSTNLKKFKLDPSLEQDIGKVSSLNHWSIPKDFHDQKIHHSFHWVKD